MSNALSEQAKQQVIALGRLGWALRRIEQETGVRRETASVYLKAAGITVGPRGRPRRQGASAKPAISVVSGLAAKPAISVATDSGPPKTAVGPSASICEPFREAIELGLRQGRNAIGIWQDLVSQSGFSGRYGTVKRFVRKLHGGQTAEACAVIITAPGEEGQVDYGRGPMVRDPETGKYRRTRLFVMTLGYSRKAVRLLTFRSSSRIWAQLHEKAFRRLAGAPRIVVLDNLKEGVLTPDIYDPTLNPLFRDVLAHYGVVALPCRINDPDRKGKVESGVGHAKKTPLKGKRFESLEEAQAYLDQVYCQRGDIENRIKELHDLEIDRTSCTSFWANQLRVLLTAAAYVLMQELRLRAAGTACARAQVHTLRERLLKLGARVMVSVRRFVIHLPASFPFLPAFRL